MSERRTRAAVVELAQRDDTTQIRAALSSETPVRIGRGLTEVLSHAEGAIDMARLGDGLPLTLGHSEMSRTSPLLPIGRVRNITLDEDRRLRGDLDFDSDDLAAEVRGKMERGFARDLSVTYTIEEESRPDKSGRVMVNRWTPEAVSVVSVPADASVGVGRSATEAIRMPEDVTPEAPASEETDIVTEIKARSNAGRHAGAQRENERLSAITDMAAGLARSLPDMAAEIEELALAARGNLNMSADAFRARAFDLISGMPEPLSIEAPTPTMPRHHRPSDSRQALVMPGGDARERAARGMEFSLLERCGSDVRAEDREGNQYRGWSMLDMARECLELAGTQTRGFSAEQIARAAIMQGRAISPGTANYVTADFPAVTENVITKRVHEGYGGAPVTWNRWASQTTVPDFKQFTIPRLSQISDLPIVNENAAYTDLTQTDAKEAATLVKHGGLMSFSWEAIVNDDQRMFARTSTSMGEAAARTVDKKVYAVLTDNGNMGDGNPLFGLAHSNDGTDALDLAGIVAARTAMARQTDDNGLDLGIELRYILVPEELRDQADNLAGSEYLPWPDSGTPGAQRVNTVRSTFQVVATIRFSDATDWYAASAMGGTVEVAFLTGNAQPALLRDLGWDTDALHWKIRHPSVAYAVDWRGLQRNVVAG